MLRLRVLQGAATPTVVSVRDGLLLGRSPEADLCCRDPLASRLHAKLIVHDGAIEVVDLGSANGTEVNGRRADRVRISAGDRVRIGDVDLVVEEASQDTETTVPVSPAAGAEPAPRIRSLLGRTTVRIQAALAMPISDPPLGVAEMPRETENDDAVSRFHRFARGATRFAEADQAMVLVRVEPGGPHVVAGYHPTPPDGGVPPIPRMLLARATQDGHALLLESEAVGPDTPGGRQRTRGTAMCAPIGPTGTDGALLYVERLPPRHPFTTVDLGPFAGLASEAAASLRQELAWFRWRVAEGLLEDAPDAGSLVGQSAAFFSMLEVAEHVAAAQSPVLLRGEPGTGRRLLARFVHDRSRPRKPYIGIAGAALPPGDEAAALFGERAGARRRPGIVEDAGAGTVCITEVADLAPAAQALLAEALSSSRFTPVGDDRAHLLRCRVVGTTRHDLQQLVAAGRFSPALAGALSGVTVGVPSLQERLDDIPLLAGHFATLHGRRHRSRPYTIAAAARDVLRHRPWPWQVAGLSNAVERAVLRAASPEIAPSDFDDDSPAAASQDLSLAAAEKAAIRRALLAAGGRKGRAAELLGISWPTLTRKVREYGLG